jgi:aspartate carbamoyltransferase catalytic subunit
LNEKKFFHVFEVADEMAPIAKSRRNSDLLAEKTLVTAFYQPAPEPDWLTRPQCIAWEVT